MRPFADFARVDAILKRVLAAPESERPALLSQLCQADPELHRKIGKLLEEGAEEQFRAGGALTGEVYAAARDAGTGAAVGTRVGAYRLGPEIGRGGMAVVYLGERVEGDFEQRVAIKLLRAGAEANELLERFLRERQILAGLRHPNIALLLDGGVTDEGRPYLVVEYVDGVAVDLYCDRERLTIDQRLELFLQICSAVQFAHRQLVVHRDLKPSNILVTDDGVTKLLDFGIAKLLKPDPAGAELTQTALEQRVLTPQYASPEQVLGEPVSTATDVHALGLLLYELLSGRRARRIHSSRPSDIERAVCDTQPVPPSAAIVDQPVQGEAHSARPIAEIAADRRQSPEQLRRSLRGDLDTIVGKALHREPERRYASADELAEDIRRHRQGLPVRAHRDSVWYRTRKFVSRRAGVVISTALVVLALVGGILATAWQAREARQEAQRAEAVVELLTKLLRDADPDRAQGRDVTVREVLDRAALRLDTELAGQPQLRADMHALIGTIYTQLGVLEPAAGQLQAALDDRRALAGGDAEDIAAVAAQLAMVRFEQGQRDKAEALARKGLERATAAYGTGDPRIARNLVALGTLEFRRGELEAGRRRLQRGLALLASEPSLRDRHMDALHMNAMLELEAGQLARAEELAQNEVDFRRASGRSQTQDMALALHLLGGIMAHRYGSDERGTDDLAAAEAAVVEAYEIERLLLGEGHPQTVSMLADVASIRAARGNIEGAEESYLQALASIRKAFGNEHAEVARVLNNIAVFYHRQYRWPEAIDYYRQSIAMRERVLEPNHPLIGTTRAYLGLALHRAGDPAAGAAYRKALAELIASRGPEHEKVGNLHTDYGVLLAEQGRYGEAEQQLRAGLAIAQPIFGDNDQRTDSARSGLGFALCGLGKVEAGKKLVQASSAWRRQHYPADFWRVAEIDLYQAACSIAGGDRTLAGERIDAIVATLDPERDATLVRLAKRLRATISRN